MDSLLKIAFTKNKHKFKIHFETLKLKLKSI